MTKLQLLLFSSLLSGCGFWPPWDKPTSNPAPSTSITASQLMQLAVIKQSALAWAQTCVDGITCLNTGSGTQTTDGDSVLYAGIACLAGEQSQCLGVKLSQAPDGQLYRSPDHLTDTSNSSSRDMLLGGLAYIVATKDTSFATSLVNYIHSHGDMLCTDATDNRCDVTLPVYSEVWGTIGKIWSYIGLPQDSTMQLGDFGESEILAGESEFSPAGYTTYLPEVEMWIRQHINGWDPVLASAAAVTASNENQNPFFEYVAHGADQTAINLVISECSDPVPTEKLYWTWSNADSTQAWLNRNGWDCISMIDMLTN